MITEKIKGDWKLHLLCVLFVCGHGGDDAVEYNIW